ncbi:MAG: hypothetical protein VB934_12260, partial [Polyangiaceae bacterium]
MQNELRKFETDFRRSARYYEVVQRGRFLWWVGGLFVLFGCGTTADGKATSSAGGATSTASGGSGGMGGATSTTGTGGTIGPSGPDAVIVTSGATDKILLRGTVLTPGAAIVGE